MRPITIARHRRDLTVERGAIPADRLCKFCLLVPRATGQLFCLRCLALYLLLQAHELATTDVEVFGKRAIVFPSNLPKKG